MYAVTLGDDGGDLAELLLTARDEHQLVAICGEQLDQPQTDAAGRAGDQRDRQDLAFTRPLPRPFARRERR